MHFSFTPRFWNHHIDLSGYQGPNKAYFIAVVDTWQHYFPRSKAVSDIDLEDWFENAARLHEADRLTPNRVIVLHNGKVIHQPDEDISDLYHLGMESGWPNENAKLIKKLGWSRVETGTDQARTYYRSPDFERLANRRVILADGSLDEGDPKSVISALKALHDADIKTAFVKASQPKYGVYEFPTKPDGNVSEDLGWAVIHMEGQPEAFIVQEKVNLEYEYRFIVIDGEIVTGAACIEEFTPLNNTGDRFDLSLRKNRRKSTKVSPGTGPRELDNKDIVDEMLAFAEGVVKSYAKHNPEMTEYTLDTGMHNGKPVLIELNPLRNYGLYAMNICHIIEKHCEQHFMDTPHVKRRMAV